MSALWHVGALRRASKRGVPQIEITFNLDTSNMLRVSANDLQGNRTRALTVQEKVRLG